MPAGYFAYGSNMNPARVRERGLVVVKAEAARLPGCRLVFDKLTNGNFGHANFGHANFGHANIVYAPGATVEGVFYHLEATDAIRVMDRFELAPVNYGREVVHVTTEAGRIPAWTYFANPAVRREGLRPERTYLDHLLAGRPFLSAPYWQWLAATPCAGDPA